VGRWLQRSDDKTEALVYLLNLGRDHFEAAPVAHVPDSGHAGLGICLHDDELAKQAAGSTLAGRGARRAQCNELTTGGTRGYVGLRGLRLRAAQCSARNTLGVGGRGASWGTRIRGYSSLICG
jgi:hypothetical protein